MDSKRKNSTLFLDIEAIATLSMAKESLLEPVTKLMNEKEAKECDATGFYNGKTFPFSFVLAPSGKTNYQVLKGSKKGDVLDLIEAHDKKKYGELVVDEVFEIDPLLRAKKIFGTTDTKHPGVNDLLKRLGKLAVCGEYSIDFEDIKRTKEKIAQSIKNINAKKTTAIMLAAKPFHRAHERVIRMALEESDLVVIFLLKPYKKDLISYELREATLYKVIDNFLPSNRVIVVPFESTYLFAGQNELILNTIVASNFGINTIVVGQNHAGLGFYYDGMVTKSIFDNLVGCSIDQKIVSEYFYCNECKTLVSRRNCPHGEHNHIHYHSDSILELLKSGLLPPAVLVRKEVSAMILGELFPNRFSDLQRLYHDILPFSGIIEEHSQEEFYIELIRLYQTTSMP